MSIRKKKKEIKRGISTNRQIQVCQKSIGNTARSLKDFVLKHEFRKLEFMTGLQRKCLSNFELQRKELQRKKHILEGQEF